MIDLPLQADAGAPSLDVVEAIVEGAGPDEPGDGDVVVLPVESAHRIRTGATGTGAV